MTDRIEPVSVSRWIAAGPEDVFALLRDPSRHVDFDGSGMLRGAIGCGPVESAGDVFVMRMYHEEFGDYEMASTVVEFEPDRLIAWEPYRRDEETEHWHYRWRYSLSPEGGGTLVTESFDLSSSPTAARQATRDGTVWLEAMRESLARLDKLCTSRPKAS